jgi:exodeoxyribonuclease VII large subunit
VLDKDADVDVIIVSRGGGALEDLLPFSDEGLVRAVAACTTPVVSAIGHEEDTPLVDLVADLRASTPTDAAKQVVPDVVEESQKVVATRDRGRYVLRSLVQREEHGLQTIRSRPALADPHRMFDQLGQHVDGLVERNRRTVRHLLDRAADDLDHRLARVRALSPLATLQRGYAVVQTTDGHVVTSAHSVTPGTQLDTRLADGRVLSTVDEALPDPRRSDDA